MAPGGPRSSTANTPTAPTLTKLFEVESLDPLPEGSQPSPIETAVPNVCGPAGLPVDRYLSIPSESGPTPDPPRRMLVSPDGNTVFPMRPGPLPENSSSYYRNPDGAAWARISGKKKGFRYASGGTLARMTGGSGEKQLQFCRVPGGDGLTGTAVYAYETNQVLQNHCQGKTGLIRAIGNVSAEDAITLARMGAMKPGKLFLAADGRQVPYTNLSEQQYCVLDPVTRADGQREYPFFMVPDLSTVQGLAGAVEASGLFGDRATAIAKALRGTVQVESEQVSVMRTQIQGLKEQLAAIKKQLWIMGGFALLTGASLYFMARQAGWTKPIDPYIDRFFLGLQHLFGLKEKVDFVREITLEMVQRGEVRPAVGREADYVRLRERMNMQRGRVTTVTARAGEGKTHFGLGFAVEIFEGRVPEFDPKNTRFHELNLNDLFGHADVKYVGQLQARWNDFVKQVEAEAKAGRQVVVFIDEIHRITGMGATEGGGANDIANAIKNKLSEWERNPRIRVNAATTVAEREQLVKNLQTGQRDEALDRRFPELRLNPLSRDQVKRILDHSAASWETATFKISQAARERALDLGFHPETKLANPDAALSILDAAQARAKTRGLPEVTADLVNEVFAENNRLPLAQIQPWRYDPAAVAATPPAPAAPATGNGGGNGSGGPRVVTTGWEPVLTRPVGVSQEALLDSLRADPGSRPLADFYEEHIGAMGRVNVMSDLINRLPPEVAAAAYAELQAQGVLDPSQAPEKAIFRLVAGAAKATGAWVDGNPLEVVRLETRFESEMRVRRGVGRSDGTGRAGAPHEEDPSRRRSRSKGRGAARLPAGRP